MRQAGRWMPRTRPVLMTAIAGGHEVSEVLPSALVHWIISCPRPLKTRTAISAMSRHAETQALKLLALHGYPRHALLLALARLPGRSGLQLRS